MLKSTGHIIGSIGINRDVEGNENYRNIGFVLRKQYWNQGLMTEALREAINHGHEVASAFSAAHEIGNTKSERILKKLGFQYVKTFKYKMPGGEEDPEENLYYVLPLRDPVDK